MRLYIIRHAWAGDPGDPRYPDDSQRPLTEDGQKRFHKLIRHLMHADFAPRRVATSPLVRCRQTARIIAEVLDNCPEPEVLNALAPGSDLEKLLDWTCRQGEQEVAWVGHNPDVGRLTATLLGASAAEIHFSKGAIASLEFLGRPGRVPAELRWLVTGKVLGV